MEREEKNEREKTAQIIEKMQTAQGFEQNVWMINSQGNWVLDKQSLLNVRGQKPVLPLGLAYNWKGIMPEYSEKTTADLPIELQKKIGNLLESPQQLRFAISPREYALQQYVLTPQQKGEYERFMQVFQPTVVLHFYDLPDVSFPNAKANDHVPKEYTFTALETVMEHFIAYTTLPYSDFFHAQTYQLSSVPQVSFAYLSSLYIDSRKQANLLLFRLLKAESYNLIPINRELLKVQNVIFCGRKVTEKERHFLMQVVENGDALLAALTKKEYSLEFMQK